MKAWMRNILSDRAADSGASADSLRVALLICVMCAAFLQGACSVRRPILPQEGRRRAESGMASWYGKDFHGRLTANGEVYDMYKISAAHKTLPLGSKVRVTNRQNGKSLVVRINDRGPFVRGRIIDLSYGGAAALGMVEAGVVPVTVETIELGDNRYYSPNKGTVSAQPLVFTVQVGSFQERGNALRLQEALRQKYGTVFIREWTDPRGVFYRVRVGKYRTEEDADTICRRLQEEYGSAFVIAD